MDDILDALKEWHAQLVADAPPRLGYEVRDKVAVTGVVATLVGGIAAQVLEWQHRDRGFVRDRRRSYRRLGRGHGGQCRAFAAELDAINANGVSNALQALLAAIDELG